MATFRLFLGNRTAAVPPSPPPPPPPPVTPTADSGGAGSIGPAFRRRRPEYRSTFEFYRSELRKQEKQRQLEELAEIARYLERVEAEPKTELPTLGLIKSGVERLLESIEQYRTEKSIAAEIGRQIQELARQIDDEESIMLLSLA